MLGLLVGIGALAIPGLGPFISAGPIMATLAGGALPSAQYLACPLGCASPVEASRHLSGTILDRPYEAFEKLQAQKLNF